MCLAKNIRYLRKQKNMSQDKLADMLGYKSYTTIQKWESGVAEPPIKIVREMANIFHVDITDLTSVDMENSDVQKSATPVYYTNPETAKKAQEMFEDPTMRVLFDMKRNMDPDKFQAHVDMMKRLYQLEHPEMTDDTGA